MTSTETPGDDQPDPDIDRQADAMKDQLRKDVASWSASRSGEAANPTKSAVPAPKQQAEPAARAPRQKPKTAEPVAPAVTEKKPFKMSYDGTTDKDYIAQRIKLGAR